MKAANFLEEAQRAIADRAERYDASGSNDPAPLMETVVKTFNALTGHDLSTSDGLAFLVILKLARARYGQPHADNYVDAAGYMALMGEVAMEDERALRCADRAIVDDLRKQLREDQARK
jgi:hypothetical protein